MIRCLVCVCFVLFAYLGAAGCSVSPEQERRICFNYESVHIRTYKSGSFNEEETANLRAVEVRILAFTGQPIEYRAIDTDDCKHPCETEGQVAGCYQNFTGEVVIRPTRFDACEEQAGASYDACFQLILMHETLHSFGLEHVMERGVMNKETSGALDFTEADRRACKLADVAYSTQADPGQHICRD